VVEKCEVVISGHREILVTQIAISSVVFQGLAVRQENEKTENYQQNFVMDFSPEKSVMTTDN